MKIQMDERTYEGKRILSMNVMEWCCDEFKAESSQHKILENSLYDVWERNQTTCPFCGGGIIYCDGDKKETPPPIIGEGDTVEYYPKGFNIVELKMIDDAFENKTINMTMFKDLDVDTVKE